MTASVRGEISPGDPPGHRATPQGALPVAKKPVTKKPASSKSKSAKRTTSAKKKPSPKGRKSKPRGTSSKAKTTKTTTKTKSRKAGDEEVTIDRRRQVDRRTGDSGENLAPILERRKKVQRRRQIDPTTCERDYSVQEVDFMNAMEKYKRKSGRMFPTCSEVLEVIRDLGYVQLTPAELAARRDGEGQVCLADANQEVATDEDTDDDTDEDIEAFVASESEQF